MFEKSANDRPKYAPFHIASQGPDAGRRRGAAAARRGWGSTLSLWTQAATRGEGGKGFVTPPQLSPHIYPHTLPPATGSEPPPIRTKEPKEPAPSLVKHKG